MTPSADKNVLLKVCLGDSCDVQGWVDADNEGVPAYEIIVGAHDEEDEAYDEQADQFEAAYNFRFEVSCLDLTPYPAICINSCTHFQACSAILDCSCLLPCPQRTTGSICDFSCVSICHSITGTVFPVMKTNCIQFIPHQDGSPLDVGVQHHCHCRRKEADKW